MNTTSYIFRSVLAFHVLVFALSGCIRQKVVADSFDPEMEILCPDSEVRSGDTFSFVVRSNHETYELESLSVDRRLTLSSGAQLPSGTFRSGEVISFSSVSVSDTHRGMISVSVKDPQTGFRRTLEKPYTAYSVAQFRLQMMDAYLADGADLHVRVFCDHASFEVRSVSCPFSLEGVSAGRTYLVGADGYVDFVARGCSVPSNGSCDVRMVVCDPESGVTETLEGSVQMRMATRVELRLVDAAGLPLNVIRNGDTFYIRIYDNQSSFTVQDFYCEFSTSLRAGSYDVPSDGFCEFVVRDAVVTSDHEGTVSLVLKDSFNDRVFRLSVDYSARVS